MSNHKLLRHAGLSDAFLRRLILACRVASARQLVLRCEPWDGTRCDVAVVAAADAYGQRAADLARRRGTPILGVHPPGMSTNPGAFPLRVSEDAATGDILDALLECLGVAARGPSTGSLQTTAASAGASTPSESAQVSLLSAMVASEGSGTSWLHAQCNGIEVFVDREGGRVCAESLEMLGIAASRAGREGWTARPHPGLQIGTPRLLASGSLDTFLLTAALSARSTLPRLPPMRFQLRQWPDLGGMPEAVDALRVVRSIQSRRLTEAEIRESAGVDETTVRACLHAFRAAGLVVGELADASATKLADVTSGASSFRTPPRVLDRLARWVGLGRRREGSMTSPDTGNRNV
jgi:hypothetical protein